MVEYCTQMLTDLNYHLCNQIQYTEQGSKLAIHKFTMTVQEWGSAGGVQQYMWYEPQDSAIVQEETISR